MKGWQILGFILIAIAILVCVRLPPGADQREERARRAIDSISSEYRALEAHDRQLLCRVRILKDSLTAAAVTTTKSKKVYEDRKKTPAVRYSDPQLDSVLSTIYPR